MIILIDNYDSFPASEYNETLIKGQSMISAITDAQEVE